MKCSVFLAQIRAGRGLAAPCPRRRWLQAWSGQEGSQHRATRSKFGAAASAGITVRAGHPPPRAKGAVSHPEERLSLLSLYSALLHMLS